MKSVKKVKVFFHMIISTILCLLIGIKSEKSEMEGDVEGRDFWNNILHTSGTKTSVFAQGIKGKLHKLWINAFHYAYHMWKRKIFWMQGPGDWILEEIG